MSTKSWKDLMNHIDPDRSKPQWIYEFSGGRRFFDKRNPYATTSGSTMVFKDTSDSMWINMDDTVFDKG